MNNNNGSHLEDTYMFIIFFMTLYNRNFNLLHHGESCERVLFRYSFNTTYFLNQRRHFPLTSCLVQVDC